MVQHLINSGRTEGAKNGAGVFAETSTPDPQVLAQPLRRQFTADYKRRIIAEADACTMPGQIGEMLRREGLYSSTLSKFREQQRTGRLDGFSRTVADARRNQREAARLRDARRIARLESENQKLRALLELQKKLAELVGLPLDQALE
jgi:transposase-like protein